MKDTDKLPTAQRLRELLNYDADTGVLTWKVRPSYQSRRRAGDVAGWVQSQTNSYNSTQYRMVNPACGGGLMAHRVIWCMVTGCWPQAEIDHINGVGTDNRWVNLREVTSLDNKRNAPTRRDNTSGVVGVVWSKRANKWYAKIKLKDSLLHLGYYLCWFDAVCARKSAEHQHGFHQNHGRRAS